jgi:hypothetical protein
MGKVSRADRMARVGRSFQSALSMRDRLREMSDAPGYRAHRLTDG